MDTAEASCCTDGGAGVSLSAETAADRAEASSSSTSIAVGDRASLAGCGRASLADGERASLA
eukprot:3912163-Pleurochrysis_carterae.AAC.1